MVRLQKRVFTSDHLLLLLIIVPVLLLEYAGAVTHWVVTEKGRIQANRASAFALRRPDDLAAVFQQMDRVNKMKTVRAHLNEIQPKNGAQLDEMDIYSLQKEVMESDENCKAAGKPVYEFDFYTSTVLPLSHFGVKFEDNVNMHAALDVPTSSSKSSSGKSTYQEPRCWIHRLDFSMHALEHLTSMRTRASLPSVAETALRSVVVPSGMTIEQFGHAIQQTIKKNQESWVAYSMASFYWRMKGNTSAAIECSRRALHHAPRRYKSEALLNLGNILHRNGQSDDAAIVVQWALDITPGLSVLHFTLGNILASLERDDEASWQYEASLHLQPRLVASAQLRLHAVKCRQALVAALNRKAKEWDSALVTLRSKQARLMALQKTINKMREEQSPDELSKLQEVVYRSWLENERRHGTVTYCQFTEEKGDNPPKMDCPSEFLSVDHQPFWADRLESKLGIGQYADALAKKYQPKRTPLPSSNRSKPPENNDTRWLYTGWATHNKPLYFEDFDWPSVEDCKNVRVPKWTDFDPTLSPPGNKGFNLSAFLLADSSSSYLNGGDQQPICSVTKTPLNNSVYSRGAFTTSEWLMSRYLVSEELDEAESLSPGSLEISLQIELLSALGCDEACVQAAGGNSALPTLMLRVGAKLAHELNEAALADRNPFALDVNASAAPPAWLLETLAISYWHSLGQYDRASDCAQAAIRDVPLRYRDMPLTALAGLLFRLSAVEDSTDAIAEALAAAPFDPQPNYFMGSMLAVKGDLLGAITHFAKALRQLPSMKIAERHLLPIACHQHQKAMLVNAESKFKSCDSEACTMQQGSVSMGKADSSDGSYPSFEFLDGTMTLLESRTNSGKVVDLYMRTTTVKPRQEQVTTKSHKQQKTKPATSSEVASDGEKQQFVVEYSDSSIPYARFSVTGDGKLTAEPHLMTVSPPPEDSTNRLELCLVFANGTLSASCYTNTAFSPFLPSITDLAKSFAETLQPKFDVRQSLSTLHCGEQICGDAVGDYLDLLPITSNPRSPETISKFIANIAKHLVNSTATKSPRPKPKLSDPLAIVVPESLGHSDELENRIRLLLAVRWSLSQQKGDFINGKSKYSTCQLSSSDASAIKVGGKALQLPDPLSIVSEGQLDSLLDRLNPDCHMPGVAVAVAHESSTSDESETGTLKSKSSVRSEPYCECSSPYKKPKGNKHQSPANSDDGRNASLAFRFSSLPDLYYPPELHLQPWAIQLQSSLKLESSRQLAAVLASHLHHSSRSNVCSDDANGWLPLTLAARYWRLRGNAAEATRCLSAAVMASSHASHLPTSSAGVTAAIPLLELSDFLRHLGYLPHSLVAAASTLVFPNQSTAAAAAARLGASFAQMERLDAAVIFYELAASAAAAFVASASSTNDSTQQPPLTSHSSVSSPSSYEHESILLRLQATTCQRDRRYRRAAMLLRRLVRGLSTTPLK